MSATGTLQDIEERISKEMVKLLNEIKYDLTPSFNYVKFKRLTILHDFLNAADGCDSCMDRDLMIQLYEY
jgi:hypothetical protein